MSTMNVCLEKTVKSSVKSRKLSEVPPENLPDRIFNGTIFDNLPNVTYNITVDLKLNGLEPHIKNLNVLHGIIKAEHFGNKSKLAIPSRIK